MQNLALILVFSLSFCCCLTAQKTPDIPREYILDKKEDYKPYEPKIIELIHWLSDTPIGTQKEDRAAATKFVFDWINGCPYVHVALHEKVFSGLIDERNKYVSDLVMAYQFAMCLWGLEHPDQPVKGPEHELQEVGIIAMVKAYQKAKNKPRSASMDKYYKMIQKNKLSKWVVKNINFEGIKVEHLPTQKNKGKRT